MALASGPPYVGATVGRYANRLGRGTFRVGGVEIVLRSAEARRVVVAA